MSFRDAFLAKVRDLPRLPDREAMIFDYVESGQYADFPVRRVTVRERQYDVATDYLALGDLDDFLRVPTSLPLARRILELTGAQLPTCAIVDEAWRRADVRLDPVTWNAEAAMNARSQQVKRLGSPFGDDSVWVQQHVRNEAVQCGVELFCEEDMLTEVERAGRTGLTAGHRKDLVQDGLDQHPGRVAIYGWHTRGGRPIQPLYLGHEDTYADYSHGLRLCWPVP